MADRLFDRFLIIDWSAARKRSVGKDSIWIADSHAPSQNLPTRQSATDHVIQIIEDALDREQRLLIGWDFAFGYPAGFAQAMGAEGWADVWDRLADATEDAPNNQSNHFEVAADLNQNLGPNVGPFWGCTQATPPAGLTRKRYQGGDRNYWSYPFSYDREVEAELKRRKQSASSVFQLAYSGCVGSQSLLGIARLHQLKQRFGEHLAIWPFETDFAEDLRAPIICAEIYPSAHPVPDGPEVKDKRQVEAVLRDFSQWDQDGHLLQKLSAPTLSGAPREAVLKEEGWVVGI